MSVLNMTNLSGFYWVQTLVNFFYHGWCWLSGYSSECWGGIIFEFTKSFVFKLGMSVNINKWLNDYLATTENLGFIFLPTDITYPSRFSGVKWSLFYTGKLDCCTYSHYTTGLYFLVLHFSGFGFKVSKHKMYQDSFRLPIFSFTLEPFIHFRNN